MKINFAKNWLDYIGIFIDASKSSHNSNVGAAYWIPKYKIILNFKYPPETSTFSGHCIAKQ